MISLTFLACFSDLKIFHSFIVDFLKVYKNQDIYHFDIYKNGFFSLHTRKVVLQGVPHVNPQKSTKEQSGFILDM